MDEGFIFYIILAAIALISQLIKKKTAAPPPKTGGGNQGKPRPQKKPFSFEEILKEFQAEVLQEEPKQTPPVVPAPASRKPTPPRSRKPKTYETLEGTDYEVLETDQEDISEKLKRYKRDEHYDLGENRLHPIFEVLNSEDGPKKAIILSEIINRKYD